MPNSGINITINGQQVPTTTTHVYYGEQPDSDDDV